MLDYYRFRFKTARGPGSNGPVELDDLRGLIIGAGIALVLILMVLTDTKLKGASSLWVVAAIVVVVSLGFGTICSEYLPRTSLVLVFLLSMATAVFGLASALSGFDLGRPEPRAVPILTSTYGCLVALASVRALRAVRRSMAPKAGKETPAA